MVKCSYCGKEKPIYTGTHLFRNTGVVAYFCSMKCRKNSDKLKRDKKKVRWTESFHVAREKARAKLKIKEAEAKEKPQEKVEPVKKATKKVEKKSK